MLRILLIVFFWVFSSSILAQIYSDIAGSKDHNLFPKRFPGFHISAYEQSENDYASFPVTSRPNSFVEKIAKGKKTVILYALKYGMKVPSKLLVRKTFTNAAKSAGAVIVYDGDGKEKRSDDDGGLYVSDDATVVYTLAGKETWASIIFNIEHPESEMSYTITIIEPLDKGEDANSSSALLKELNAKGRIELYVKFDNGKDLLKPESEPFIAEVVKLLASNPELKLSIEGHSDNVGDANANIMLSEKRAKSVLNSLVKSGINADRLSAVGLGASNPLANNATEEGKALNRRVELVKK